MRVSDPLNALAAALTLARQRDLPDIHWAWQGRSGKRRPMQEELDVRLFLQTWGNTSLGFDMHDGLAGASMTTAPTVVVMKNGAASAYLSAACVYFGETLAYRVPKMNDNFIQDMQAGHMAAQSCAAERYGAEIAPPMEGSWA